MRLQIKIQFELRFLDCVLIGHPILSVSYLSPLPLSFLWWYYLLEKYIATCRGRYILFFIKYNPTQSRLFLFLFYTFHLISMSIYFTSATIFFCWRVNMTTCLTKCAKFPISKFRKSILDMSFIQFQSDHKVYGFIISGLLLYFLINHIAPFIVFNLLRWDWPLCFFSTSSRTFITTKSPEQAIAITHISDIRYCFQTIKHSIILAYFGRATYHTVALKRIYLSARIGLFKKSS